jgi:Na+/proline symporter
VNRFTTAGERQELDFDLSRQPALDRAVAAKGDGSMNWSAKSAAVLFGYAAALTWFALCLAIAAYQTHTLVLARISHGRCHPPLGSQVPPRWLAPLAGAVLVMALAALRMAMLLDDVDGAR